MTIIKAKPTEHKLIRDILTRSFFHEEFCNWAIQADQLDSEIKTKRLQDYFSLQLKHIAEPHNEVYTNLGHTVAALWIPPEQWDLNLFEQLKLLPKLCKIIGIKHLIKVLHVINLVQKQHPNTPHFYLQLIGVDPLTQNQGWARKALSPILNRSDQDQTPCYLETATPSHVGLYRHFGFEVIYHLQDLPYQAPEIWGMWREPK